MTVPRPIPAMFCGETSSRGECGPQKRGSPSRGGSRRLWDGARALAHQALAEPVVRYDLAKSAREGVVRQWLLDTP